MAADEDPFDLIKKGNAFEGASDHWRAAEFYSRASVCLKSRADDLSFQIRSSSNSGQSDEAAVGEKRKVISLFRAQSLEYMYKARHCLLEALRFENEQDRSNTLEVAKTGSGSLDPLFSLIAEEERTKRAVIFNTLFTGIWEERDSEKPDVAEVGTQADTTLLVDETGAGSSEQTNGSEEIKGNRIETDEDAERIDATTSSQADNTARNPNPNNNIDDRQQDIESRLAQLDSSLLPNVPPPFISGSRTSGCTDGKLEDIQRGLKGLGVYVPDSSGKRSDLLHENLSADDQVKLIIQQAQDEVRVEKGLHNEQSGESNDFVNTSGLDDSSVIGEDDSMFEGFEDDEDDDMNIETLLAKAESLVKKTDDEVIAGGEHSTSELIRIRKVQALLLETRLCLEMVQSQKSSEEEVKPTTEAEEGTKDKDQDETDDDDEDDKSRESNNDNENNGSDAAARKKANELIGNANDCLTKLMKEWK